MMRLFLPVKQALILAGRGSDRGPKEKEAKLAERPSPVQKSKAKISYNINVSQSNFVDTPNNWVSDSGASIELHPKLRPRQADSLNTNTDVSTCGYLNGNAGLPRTANPGFDCRVDTKNAIWGFCPTTILAVSDCGLVGGCVDLHACSGGCGIADDPSVTTFTWFVNLLTSTLAISPPCPISALVGLIANT